jgi:hypothetical protein
MTPITEKTIGVDGELFAERRGGTRRRMFKGGTLRFNKGYGALECVVRNRSDSGALLHFSDTSAVPPAFDLKIGTDEEFRPAEVKWRKLNTIGVAFR